MLNEKEGKKFMKERKRAMKFYSKLIRPSIDYDKEYDIFSICWGNKKCYCTIELSQDLRFDISKDGTIIGIEIEDFSKKLKENKL